MSNLPPSWAFVLMGNISSDFPYSSISIPNNVIFIDPVSLDDLPEYTSSASLGLIPYLNNCLNHEYASPNKIWEYSSSGVPLLSSNLKFISSLIKTHNMGTTSDLEELSDIITYIDDLPWRNTKKMHYSLHPPRHGSHQYRHSLTIVIQSL